jgi:cytoskeleton protein RodZ
MAAEAGGDQRAGIGSRLRAAREKKGLTVLQAAEKLHVDSKVVEALEAEDFAALGAAVYARGHLRHYAELVDERPAELQELYASATRPAPVQPDLTRISRPLPDSESSKLAGPAVTVLVAIALVGTVWWVMTLSNDKAQPTSVQTASAPAPQKAHNSETDTETNTAANAAVGANTPASPPVPPAPGVDAGTQRGQQAVGKSAKGATPAGAAATAAANRAPTSPNATTITAATPAAAPTTASATAPPTSHPKDAELTLKFSSDSWAEVYDASGQRLFYDVGAASSAHTVRGPAPMRVVLGNASGVALEYNGRPALIPSGVLPDGSVRFVINAHGRAVPATGGD